MTESVIIQFIWFYIVTKLRHERLFKLTRLHKQINMRMTGSISRFQIICDKNTAKWKIYNIFTLEINSNIHTKYITTTIV